MLNFLPARLSALLMLAAGALLGLDVKTAGGSTAGTAATTPAPTPPRPRPCAPGFWVWRLAGDAWYHGVLHRKPFIGDPVREIRHDDITRTCRLMYLTALLALLLCGGVKLALILL